ncbi:MAG: hypothetical protein CL840_03560 [Crocinitomicaceae bacterium]|nr:hypothetical protein [Crocinitomicaceae bacterium]|tara:strand:+ start:299231 stop:300697 length:1467 start_codon:yes stop_codon:yes gene_type:complete
MSNQESNSRDVELEWLGIFLIFALGSIVAAMFFYVEAWYPIKKWIFFALNSIPEPVRNVIFFYSDTVRQFIEPMYHDLVFHAEDYAEYYIYDDVGIKKYHSMNTVTQLVFGPFLLPAIIYMITKEALRKDGLIDKPGKGQAMYSFARSQMEIWPYIKPVAPIMEKISKETSLESGWYAMATMPMSWLKKHGLLKTSKKVRRALITQRERLEFTLDRKKTYLTLMDELGRPWRGVDDLTFNEKCVLAVLAPHIYGRVKDSRLLNRLMGDYNIAETNIAKKGLKALFNKEGKAKKQMRKEIEAEVNRIIEMYRNDFERPFFDATEFDEPYDPLISSLEALDSEKEMFEKGTRMVKEILLTHGYVKTVFYALMERAWEYGVLSSGEMLWVKKVDRDLFYVLSQQGRRSCFVEPCASWSHYLAESTFGFRVISPQLIEGIRAYDFDLFKTHTNYIAHETWEDKSKWDKLVPDINKKSALPSAASANATADVI